MKGSRTIMVREGDVEVRSRGVLMSTSTEGGWRIRVRLVE
jgi:hypothetical protein